MMNDKQILQMIESLGKNSRIARSSKSLAASSVDSKARDQECAAMIKKIITGNDDNLISSLAAAAANPNPNVNRVKTLYNFVINNHLK